jgi:hypothetical protein
MLLGHKLPLYTRDVIDFVLQCEMLSRAMRLRLVVGDTVSSPALLTALSTFCPNPYDSRELRGYRLSPLLSQAILKHVSCTPHAPNLRPHASEATVGSIMRTWNQK